MSRLIQMHQSKGTREELEPAVLALAGDEPVAYLGVQGPTRGGTSGDDPWPVHVWQVGLPESRVNPAYTPSAPDAGPKHRKDTAVYDRTAGLSPRGHVGPVDFSRPELEPVAVEFPAPVVGATSDPEVIVRAPNPVTELEAYAASLGWDTMITYAKGWVPHASWGTPNKGGARESWGVRLRRGPFRAVAVRMNGSWASMWTWSDKDRFTHHKTLGAFQEAIR